jgi:hypothetical protein
MSFTRITTLGVFALVGSAACSSVDEAAVEQELPSGGGCDEWGCGGNSPVIDHLGIHDIHGEVGGLANANGFRVTGIEKQMCGGCLPKPFTRVYSKGGNLFVTDGVVTLSGGAVAGTIITVENSSNKYEIRIAKLGRTPYWAEIATGDGVATTYYLDWDVVVVGDQKRQWKNVCSKPPGDNSPDLLGMDSVASVVFENDNIDSHKKTVSLRGEKHWFNIGCAGHALAKLHLSGHTTGAQNDEGFHTTEQERQATLKMITADYCGTGYAFTVAGQPLQWTDQHGWNTYTIGFAGKKEAEWTEKGASCLNEPRINANPTVPGLAAFPDVELDIKNECGGRRPDPCADADALVLNGSHIISSNP